MLDTLYLHVILVFAGITNERALLELQDFK